MIQFEYSWALVLLFAPLFVRFFVSAYHTPKAALRVSVFKQLVEISGSKPGKGASILRRNLWQKFILYFSWLCIVVAAAGPVWLGDSQFIRQPSRDLMMAVDLSGSMDAEDFLFEGKEPTDRLSGVKTVIDAFLLGRDGDRLGLIVFGSRPYLQVPFTLDHKLFQQLLDETRTRMAGPKTMLGDAIGLAVNHFSSSDQPRKVLILLTDGNDSGSRIPPIDAAQVAADAGITIHTIAVGDPAASGEQELDLQTLEQISALSGGVFFRASNGDQLHEVYQSLQQLEPKEINSISYRPKESLFIWPLAIALVVQLLFQWSRLALSLIASRRFAPSQKFEGTEP